MARAGLGVSVRGARPTSSLPACPTARRLWEWMRQQRLLPRLRCLREQRAAVAVGCGDKTHSHVVAEKRNFRDVGSLLERQGAAGVAKWPAQGTETSTHPVLMGSPHAGLYRGRNVEFKQRSNRERASNDWQKLDMVRWRSRRPINGGNGGTTKDRWHCPIRRRRVLRWQKPFAPPHPPRAASRRRPAPEKGQSRAFERRGGTRGMGDRRSKGGRRRWKGGRSHFGGRSKAIEGHVARTIALFGFDGGPPTVSTLMRPVSSNRSIAFASFFDV